MTSSFSGLTRASAALAAQQYALEVTGQNVANASTPGYTRKRAELAEVGPVSGTPQLYATQPHVAGVTVNGTSRLNDMVLDARVRTEHGKDGYAKTSSAQLSGIEGLFNEPSDNGLGEQLNDLWNAWSTVANSPDNLPARTVLLQKAGAVADRLNATASTLSQLGASAQQQLQQNMLTINTTASSLAQVNAALAIAHATGSDANSLADQRDSLLMSLADVSGAQAILQPDGSATVTLGGQTLVAGSTASTAAVNSAGQLTVGGAAAGAAGGSTQGLLDAVTITIPGYTAQLDGVAAALANTVNTAHQAGYDLSGAAGGPFFTGTTAATIGVAISDPAKVAASGVPGGNLDASNAVTISRLGTATGGADEAYRALVTTIASQSRSASQAASTQDAVTSSVDAQRQSVSGVSLDEETSNMLTFQRAYQASSRVLTTVDDMLDTLINKTGRVGL